MADKSYSVGDITRLTGYSSTTLARWHNTGQFVADHLSLKGKKKYYSQAQLDKLLNTRLDVPKKSRLIVGYARVSSNHQKDDLNRQVETLSTYLTAQGSPFELIQDIGSGMNFNKRGLTQLLDKIEHDEVGKIVVTYRDRLLRFGFELFKQICDKHDVAIEIINQTSELSDEQELANDLIEIITVFSAKLYGKRSHKNQKIVTLLKDDSNDKNT